MHNSPKRHLLKYLCNNELLHSAAALRALQQKTTLTLWKIFWEKSPRYARTRVIDPTMPSSAFIKLVDGIPKRSASLYIQLRTRHIPLNLHLHRIGKVDSPHCLACPGTNKTIHHFIFDCPQYRRERHFLRSALERDVASILYILTSDKATPHVIRYINRTNRFKSTFGEK